MEERVVDESVGDVTGFDETRVDFETFGERVERGTSFERVGEGVVVVR